MVAKAFTECLADIYRGEVIGEAAFGGMLEVAADIQQRYILGSLLQLETEGKAIVRPLLLRLGLSLVESGEGRAAGLGAAARLNALPWSERFAALQEALRSKYLPRYLELSTLVAPDEDPEAARIAAFMARHEQALLAVAENIVSGKQNPVEPIVGLMHFPLPQPRSA